MRIPTDELERAKQNVLYVENIMMDQNDPWDVWIAEKFGKPFVVPKPGSDESMVLLEPGVDRNDPKVWFEEGQGFLSGRQYEDGFGPWGEPGSRIGITKQPTRMYAPTELDEYFRGKARYAIDWFCQGQADGPGTPRSVWVVRLWDTYRGTEVPNSRFFADKLSWAMSALTLVIPL